MAVFLSPVGGAGAQFFDGNGDPLSGGKLYTYSAGTTTPAVTYTSSAGNTAHSNPIILDAAGRVPGSSEIWLTDSVAYKFVLKDSNDVLQATWDNITGINSSGIRTNASLVTYDPPYAGSESTTVEDKLAQTVSVNDFGADPTGVVDSTIAIQAALNSGAGVVSLEVGTYLFTSVTIPENVSLVGQGSTKTFLETATSGNAITFDGAYNTQLHGFTLNQTGPVQGKGLYLIDQYFVTMIDVTTNGFEYGLYAIQALYHYIRECKFEGGAYGAYYGGTGTVWNVDWFNNVLTFENCRFNSNTTMGTYIKGCEVIFANCDWSNLPNIGLKVEGVSQSYNAHGIQIIQPYAESIETVFSFSYAFVEIDGGFVQGKNSGSPATSIVDVADYSTVFWKGRPRDSDYWDFGYRVTNNSALTFDAGFTQSVRTSNTVDGTSSVKYAVSEVTPGVTETAVASYNSVGLKRNYTDGVASVPPATPTTTGVLTNRTGTAVYLVTAVGYDGSAIQEIGGLAFVTIYNDGTTKRAAINSISTQRFTWSSISTDGTITFQHSATNATTITFNAVKMN